MRHGSLFSGIGGFDLAAEWMGWENVFHCEINEFCNKVLNHYWPDAKKYTDIKTTDFNIWRGTIDIITGGFPCQPFSGAGNRKGKEDDRYLWPEMLRAIREIQPRWVVCENVSGLLNWNRGMVLDEIKADLETAGFEVLPPLVLPACAVNAPHRRDRVWIVAHAINNRHNTGRKAESGQDSLQGICGQAVDTGEFNGASVSRVTENTNEDGRGSNKRKEEPCIGKFGNAGTGNNERIPANDAEVGITSNTNSKGREEREQVRGWQNTTEDRTGTDDRLERHGDEWDAANTDSSGWGQSTVQSELRAKEFEQLQGDTRGTGQEGVGWEQWEKPNFDNFPTQSPICSRDDGLSYGLDGITFSKWRNESIKAYGNSVVPQIVFEIFKAIEQCPEQLSCTNNTSIIAS